MLAVIANETIELTVSWNKGILAKFAKFLEKHANDRHVSLAAYTQSKALQLSSIAILINKPGTAKIGAISEAQNCKKRGPLGFVKLQLVAKFQKKNEGGPFGDIFKNSKKKFKIEIFEQCHSAEN